MENPAVVNPPRTYTYTKRRTLMDGTVKEYKYQQDYKPKTTIVSRTGKSELRKRLIACRDREKIKQIQELFDRLEI